MIVESEEALAFLMASVCEKEGHQCQTCDSAEEAINRMEEQAKHGHDPDIIFLDIHLPKMDGAELCEILRGKTPFARGTWLETKSWITVCTNDTIPASRTAMLRAGANDFLQKPLTEHMILQKLREIEQVKKLTVARMKPFEIQIG